VLEAWLEGAAYMEGLTSNYRLGRSGQVWVEQGDRLFGNPVPRQFRFRKLFTALADDAEGVVRAVNDALDSPDEEHVLNVFGADGEETAGRFEPLGYELAWVFSLFGFEPVGELAQPYLDDPGWDLRPARDASDIEAINAQDPDFPSYAELLGDPRAHEVMVFEGERPISKGFFVEGAPGIVHVLGMFTLPDYRRRGLARAVIDALHLEAQRRHVALCVLDPSLMAARHGVYPALGYRTLTYGARLVPRR
jgi:GNAT superfamily N-acetyltransferase